MPSSAELVRTPLGPARVAINRPAGASGQPVRPARATLVLGHGAGGGPRGGIDARDLAALAATLPAYDVAVLRVEQPWRVAGKRLAPAPARLDEAWRAVLPALPVEGALVVGGRSAGARVACRTAREVGARACLALAFPLHPPGRPERSRLPELLAAGVPTVVVQGERDTFGGPADFPAEVDVRPVPAADHSFRATRAAAGAAGADPLSVLVLHVVSWLSRPNL